MWFHAYQNHETLLYSSYELDRLKIAAKSLVYQSFSYFPSPSLSLPKENVTELGKTHWHENWSFVCKKKSFKFRRDILCHWFSSRGFFMSAIKIDAMNKNRCRKMPSLLEICNVFIYCALKHDAKRNRHINILFFNLRFFPDFCAYFFSTISCARSQFFHPFHCSLRANWIRQDKAGKNHWNLFRVAGKK